ncbi:cysteine hydrolase family protein [Novosphingobium colocasiae]
MVQIPAQPYDFVFDPAKAALLIIDMQRDFVEPGGFGAMLGNDVGQLRGAIAPLVALLAAARQAGLFVMHTREGHKPDLSDLHESKRLRGKGTTTIGDSGPMGRILIAGEPGHDIIPELYPIAGEPVIDKPGKGAFYDTELADIVAQRRLTQLIVCGVTTEVCVHTTVREANDRGIDCLVLADCTASYFSRISRSRPAHDRGARRHLWLGHRLGERHFRAHRTGGTGSRLTKGGSTHDDDDRKAGKSGQFASLVDTRRLERLLRVRDQYPRQRARADGPVAVRAQDAGRDRVRPHPAGRRPDDVPFNLLLRLACPQAGDPDRAGRRLRAAIGDQRAAHVRGRVRRHAADPAR